MGSAPEDNRNGGDLWAHTFTSLRDNEERLHVPAAPLESTSSPADEGRTGSRWTVVLLIAVLAVWVLAWQFTPTIMRFLNGS